MHSAIRNPFAPFHHAVVFLFFALTVAGLGANMLADTDPLWHIATGDLIRQSNALPLTDTWSFTAGDYRWLNVAWAWDVDFSIIYQHAGWHGAVAVNALIIALMLTLVYAAGFRRSGSLITAFAATFATVTVLSPLLRPLQVTHLMTALWLLILGQAARRSCRLAWLSLLPVTMLLWVNMHGGFLVGFVLLAAFFLQALFLRDGAFAKALFLVGFTSAAACLMTPYGIDIIETVRRPLFTEANRFILEWQPFGFSREELIKHAYVIAFVLLVPGRRLPVLACERWLAYFWLAMAIASVRHMGIFAIISAPVFACALYKLFPFKSRMARESERMKAALASLARPLNLLAILAAVGAAAWLPTASAARHYRQETLAPPSLADALGYLEKYYPDARVFTHFNLGGIVLWETRGAVPVFFDPRTETAYPPELISDYIGIVEGAEGWERLLDRHAVTALLLPNDDVDNLLPRFGNHPGWETAFIGPLATVFVRKE